MAEAVKTFSINWQPNADGLNQILALLRDSQNPNPTIQQRVNQQFQALNAVPDLNNYLVYVFTKARNEPDYVRAVAGLILKNNIKENYTNIPEEVKFYIKQEILRCLEDPQAQVRKTLSSIVTTLLLKGGISSWPGLLQTLVQCLDSNDANAVDGAFNTLLIICEDYAYKLDSDEAGRPLNALIPKFLSFFRSPHEILRKYAISCINQFIVEMPSALAANMDSFLQGIFYLANDPSADVRKKVCQAFVMITEVRVEYLLPFMKNVVQYMIQATQDKDELVALEACEFWSSLCDNQKIAKQALAEHLPTLVPVLLNKMAYSDDDPMLLLSQEEDSTPDQAKDIRPIFHNTSKMNSRHSNTNTQDENVHNTSIGSQEEDDEEDEDDDLEEELGEWNLRKCAAAGIDILALVFKESLLSFILGSIQEKINDRNNWKNRESAILALGAIADGCLNGMKPHLPQLVPYLCALMNDPHPLIRSITCWTTSRYSKWIVRQRDVDKYFKPILFHLMTRMLEPNKKVQEAACSAFATLEEEARGDLIPFLSQILTCLMTAFNRYQAKNLLILYDAIGTLADSVGKHLNAPEHINILMPPLIIRWNELRDDDKNLLPLLECLTSISAALGSGFVNFAPPVFQRCIRLIESTLIQEALATQQQGEFPDKDFMVCGIDLISGIVDGLEGNALPLITNSNLINLLFQCMKDQRPDVRQSSFAVVGDISRHCFAALKPAIKDYIPVLIKNLFAEYIAVCNNAAWALGEIGLKIGEEMKPFVPSIMERLIPIINKRTLNENLLENAAITIGRMGLIAPDILAPGVEDYIESWCVTLREMHDDSEKDSAFRGLTQIIQVNPNGVVKHFVYVCDAINSWERPKQDLKDTFYAILHGFKNSVGPQLWNDFYNAFPEHLRSDLQQKYQL